VRSAIPLLVGAALVASADRSLAQSAGADSSAPYLRRGNQVERRYSAYREELQRFYDSLSARVDREALELRARLSPPAAVPYGYQILPTLLADTPWQPAPTRIMLSSFSWPKTDSLITRDSAKLVAIRTPPTSGHADLETIVADYLALAKDQKLAASQIQYNRLWQGQVARSPASYVAARAQQAAALLLQARPESARVQGGRPGDRDSLQRVVDEAVKKLPAPSFVQVIRPVPHRWVVAVPMYTDITDSAFVERFRQAVESAWHVRAGEDEYSVSLDIRRLPPAQLYPNGRVPDKGEHVDVGAHVARFPQDGAVLTTGANSIYSLGRAIVLGPHAIGPSALIHEFGHTLGFRDGYFRSYDDLGGDGYRILEVILDPLTIVAAPEHGYVRLEHFLQLIAERTH
jgi:hypothetical protein